MPLLKQPGHSPSAHCARSALPRTASAATVLASPSACFQRLAAASTVLMRLRIPKTAADVT
ncbi:hypothetical protein V6Z96_008931 [Aspergillus fumigatus]